MILLVISGLILIAISGISQISNLQPVFENGVMPVVKAASSTLFSHMAK